MESENIKQNNMKSTPIVVEQTVSAPIEKVWKAITCKREMEKWYFNIGEFEPVINFKFHFYGGKGERQYLHLCQITEVERNRKIAYSWRFNGYRGSSVVSFDLSSEGDKTKVRLTHEGVDSFISNDSNMDRESFKAGWEEIIGTSLKKHVEVNL